MLSRDEADPVLSAFKNSLEGGRLAHAYLVVGAPRGNAERLAEQVLCLLCCESAGDRPCGECSACRRVMERTHPDMMWVEPRKKSRTIQREQILDIQQHVFHTSFEGGWKSVVLVNAERMNDVASNTLLKMLEEPPAATLFLLLTDTPESLLPTVVSRCQRVVVSGTRAHGLPSDLPAVALRCPPNHLGEGGATAEALAKAGAPVKAVASEEVNNALRSAVSDIMTNTAAPGRGVIVGMARARLMLDLLKDVRKRMEAGEKEDLAPEHAAAEFREGMKDVLAARVEARYREARGFILRSLLQWYRDMLLCVCGVDESAFYFGEMSERIREMCAGLTCRQALSNIRQIEDMQEQLDQHLAEVMVFERGMTRLQNG